ncbi:arsenic resistance protein [Acinetobacter boissieri]|uniref:Arsenite efflux pump ArsB, ACR3 family n=1 Tax=Acinetobacter boissieri TaxID=1219383 RepID=A0A1G6HK31_9GAMM|nr:arsenic resistance protein [Acinetobacter boissieri]SDB94551.1 Arsenite efflux pump ArsB, ACR3 family [Acinetobacter boissieri]
MEKLRHRLEDNQVKIYFTSICLGAIWGLIIHGISDLEPLINPALALMLFVTFLQVPITEIRHAFKNIRFISALFISNFIALPLVTAGLIQFLPDNSFIRLAVLFVLLAPCIDYVITFTSIGKGNAKLLLAMTPILLLTQMVLLPIYIGVLLGNNVSKLIEVGPFLHAFIWFIIVPLTLAALVQWLSNKSTSFTKFTVPLNLLPVPATALVLFIVLASVTPQIRLAQNAALQALPIYIAFAIISPVISWIIASLFKLEASSARAISFSASYRNSLIILPLALAVPGSMPIIPAVILTQTIVELCFLPVYLRCIPKIFPSRA